MGWSQQVNWRSAKDVYAEYIDCAKRNDVVHYVGRSGAFLKCIDKRNDRPYLVQLLVHNHRNGEVYVKELDSTYTGANEINIAAADWLRRELAKRNLAPGSIYEADWLAQCERRKRLDKYIENLTPMDKLTAIRDVTMSSGIVFEKGDQFQFLYKRRQKIICRIAGIQCAMHYDVFFDTSLRDYPIVAII